MAAVASTATATTPSRAARSPLGAADRPLLDGRRGVRAGAAPGAVSVGVSRSSLQWVSATTRGQRGTSPSPPGRHVPCRLRHGLRRRIEAPPRPASRRGGRAGGRRRFRGNVSRFGEWNVLCGSDRRPIPDRVRPFVGVDDRLDQRMTDDVRLVQEHHADARHVAEPLHGVGKAAHGEPAAGRSGSRRPSPRSGRSAPSGSRTSSSARRSRSAPRPG